jgi:hypothetical protein
MTTSTQTQRAARFRSDTNSVDTAATWLAAENANITLTCLTDQVLRLRLSIQCSSTAQNAVGWQLQFQRNGGGYVTSVSPTSAWVSGADASSSADETALTVRQLSVGTGSFVNGLYDETGTTGTIGITASNYIEFEFGINIKAADVADGDTLDFHLFKAGGPPTQISAYTVTPRITVSKTSTGFGGLRGALEVSAASVTNPLTASGSVAGVSVYDLIVVLFGEATNLTVTAITDNLGNTYSAVDAGFSSGWTNRAFYALVTPGHAGTLTSVSATTTASSDDALMVVGVFEGPFAVSPLDAAPAQVADNSSPFVTPSTGTLAQADELILAWDSGTFNSAASPSAASPFTKLAEITLSLETLSLFSTVVSSTSSVSTQFTSLLLGSGNIVGIASFKKGTAYVPAFGDLKGFLSVVQASATNPCVISGSVSVAVDDLIVVVYGQQLTQTSTGVTDNLGNTYAAVDAGNAGGGGGGRPTRSYYARVTSAGTLTTVNIAATASTDDTQAHALIFEGPFASSPLDKTPGYTTDTSGPGTHTGPSTGTLSQADELVVAYVHGSIITNLPNFVPVSPLIALGQTGQILANLAAAAVVVSSTASVATSWTSSGTGSSAVTAMGAASFKKSATGPTAWDGASTHAGVGSLSSIVNQAHSVTPTLPGVGSLQALASQVHSVTPTLPGIGSLSASAFIMKFAAATFGGQGSLSVDTIKSKSGEATLNGSGNFSALVNLRADADCTFGGVGSLSGTVVARLSAASTFAGFGSLSVDASVVSPAGQVQSGEATFAGASSFSIDTIKFKTVEATFIGAGSLSVDTIKSKSIEATFAGAGSFSIDTIKFKTAAATFSGAGALTVSGLLAATSAAIFGGLGSLSVDTQKSKTAAATFGGTGTLSANVSARFVLAATFGGQGSLSALAATIQPIAGTFAGIGSLVIEATILGAANIWSGEARFDGIGSLSAFVIQRQAGVATFQGAGSLSAATQEQLAAFANLQGAGSLAVATQKFKQAQATFQGSGASIASMLQVMAGAAIFGGSGSLSVNTLKTKTAQATFAGAGTLNAFAFIVGAANVWSGEASLQGAGSLSINTNLKISISPIFSGAGNFSIQVRTGYAASVVFTGTGAALFGVVSRNVAAARFDGIGALSLNSNLRERLEARFNGAGNIAANAVIVPFGANFAEARFSGQGAMIVDLLQFGPRRVRSSRGGTFPFVSTRVAASTERRSQPAPIKRTG